MSGDKEWQCSEEMRICDLIKQHTNTLVHLCKVRLQRMRREGGGKTCLTCPLPALWEPEEEEAGIHVMLLSSDRAHCNSAQLVWPWLNDC